ncbi:MAG TPA: NACHT domain-containing protein [Bacteroidales bacterium]|nr:NACHT domain-containing protein [Bacteroidales bacterium]
MISEQTLSLIETFKEPILSALSDIKNEVQFFLDDGLSEYVENQKNKLSKTKTFLFREEKVNFYDIYFPVSIRNRRRKIENFQEIEDLFIEKQYITLIGNAGSGKSMLLKHIFLSSITDLFKIPILVELRNLNEFNGTITDYIYQFIFRNKLAPNSKILERILSNGNFLFLLDGYDEIYSENKNKISNDIEEFIDTYTKNIFVLTSRPGANAESFQRFDNFQVESLNSQQINDFIKLQLKVSDNIDATERIIQVVEKPDNKEYKAYLNSPLLLSMFIFTFNSYPELPRLKSRFYWNVFDTLCSKHDSFTKKGCWQHERKTGLQNEDLELVLKWFSFVSIFKGKYTFDAQYLNTTLLEIKNKLNLQCDINDLVYDLTVSIAIIIIDGIEFTFPHKSLQEYFCALLIKDLTLEQKQKTYQERFLSLQRHTHGGNLNLYSLCYELDKFSFTEFFILKNLNDFYSSIDFTNRETRVFSFLKIINFSQGFRKVLDTGQYEFKSFSYSAIIVESIFSYLSIFRYHRLNLDMYEKAKNNIESIVDKIAIRESEKRIDENCINYWIPYSNIWNEDLYKFIEQVGLADQIIKTINKVAQQIELIQNELAFEKKNMQSLLDF